MRLPQGALKGRVHLKEVELDGRSKNSVYNDPMAGYPYSFGLKPQWDSVIVQICRSELALATR